MKTKFTLWKRAARSILLVLLLSAAGLTKALSINLIINNLKMQSQ